MGIYKKYGINTLRDLMWVTAKDPFYTAREMERRKRGRGRLRDAGVYVVECTIVPTLERIARVNLMSHIKENAEKYLPVAWKGSIGGSVYGDAPVFPEGTDEEAIKKQLMEYYDGTVAREIEEEIQKHHEEKKA